MGRAMEKMGFVLVFRSFGLASFATSPGTMVHAIVYRFAFRGGGGGAGCGYNTWSEED
jgi:hypothetical protein